MTQLVEMQGASRRPRCDTIDAMPAMIDLLAQLAITHEDEARLSALYGDLVPHVDSMADEFAAWICALPSSEEILSPEDTAPHVRNMLRVWLTGLLLGPRDNAYRDHRIEIGRRHLRVGLNPSYVFTAMSKLRELVLTVIADELPGDFSEHQRVQRSVCKVLDLDLAIMMGGHHEAEMLESLRSELERALREHEGLIRLGQQVAVVAHELKTPLAAINAACQVLESRVDRTIDGIDVVDEVLQRVRWLDKTVEDLLAYARPRPPQLEPIPILQLVRDTVSTFARTSQGRPHQLEITGGEVRVPIDIGMTRAVLLNLLCNAAAAIGDDGGRIAIDVSATTRLAEVSVSDSGPGIPEEVRARIFEPFFTTRSDGTGLGLPIARRLMRTQGGDLTAGFPSGGGTLMTLHLPLAS